MITILYNNNIGRNYIIIQTYIRFGIFGLGSGQVIIRELCDTIQDDTLLLNSRSDKSFISDNDDTLVMTIRGSQQNAAPNVLDKD